MSSICQFILQMAVMVPAEPGQSQKPFLGLPHGCTEPGPPSPACIGLLGSWIPSGAAGTSTNAYNGIAGGGFTI